jgi:hypothetical protein
MTFAAVALISSAAALAFWSSDSAATVTGYCYLVLGALWCVLGHRGRLEPKDASWALGSLLLVVGPQVLAIADWHRVSFFGYLLMGDALCLVLLSAGGRLRNTTPVAVGAVSVVIFTTQLCHRVFGDAIGLPALLLIGGLLLVGMSTVGFYLRSRMRDGQGRKAG